MIEQDRELLARAATINRQLGTVVSDMMACQVDGELPAGRLRQLGEALTQLGTDMVARAAEIDGHTLGRDPHRMVIDPLPED